MWFLTGNLYSYGYKTVSGFGMKLRNARRLAAMVNWPPISWVDWPPHGGQLATGLIMLMTSEQPV